MREDFKKEKGITLIALVITIIVLLILAGISIATLTGQNGILTQAKSAKEQTDEKGAYEEVQLEVAGSFDDGGNYSSSLAKSNLENNLKATVTDKGNGKLQVEYKGYTFNIDMDGRVSEKPNIDYSKFKIGDYVNYQPDDVTTAYDKFGEVYSGYANGDIGQDDNLSWRILNINEAEDAIELISDRPTTEKVAFKGARGYNNGVALLNDYCKNMYSNNSKGAIARSLNIEDIQDKMKIDETTNQKKYESYRNLKDIAYKTGTFSYSKYKWYPVQWKKDNGVEGESEPKIPGASDIVQYLSEDDAKTQETSGNLTVTQTYWTLDSTTMSENFEIADTRESTEASDMYYNLLCGTIEHWLASRYVDTSNQSYAKFGLRYMYLSGIISTDLFQSYSNTNTYLGPIRPVVSLPVDAIDLNTDYEKEGKWNLNNN